MGMREMIEGHVTHEDAAHLNASRMRRLRPSEEKEQLDYGKCDNVSMDS